MTNYQTAQLNMHHALSTFLDANLSVYSANTPMVQVITDYKTKAAAIDNLGNILATDKTSFSEQKQKLKINLSHTLSDICSLAKVGLTKSNLAVEAGQLELSQASYGKLADPDFLFLANANRKIINDNLTVLVPDYLSTTDIADLDAAINAFANAKGTSDTVQKNSPAIRAEFKNQLEVILTVIKQIRLLAKRYKKSNPVFYRELLSESTISKISIRHTTLQITIRNEEDGTPIEAAAVKLSKTKKAGISDASGQVTIEEIRNGKMKITIEATGFESLDQEVLIEQGKQNHFFIELKKAA